MFEIPQPLDVMRGFELRGYGGKWLRSVIEPADRVTPESIGNLWHDLDELEPLVRRPQLSVAR